MEMVAQWKVYETYAIIRRKAAVSAPQTKSKAKLKSSVRIVDLK
jgi:hypothetical protein